MVSLDDEQLAAVEGWRRAHRIEDQSEAIGEIVRIGLLSEIARIYRAFSSDDLAPRPTGEKE